MGKGWWGEVAETRRRVRIFSPMGWNELEPNRGGDDGPGMFAEWGKL